MRHTFSLVCAGLLALTLLAGCEKTTAPKTVRAPLSVETLTVEAADQPRWITLLGQAEGGREVEVKSQVSMAQDPTWPSWKLRRAARRSRHEA